MPASSLPAPSLPALSGINVVDMGWLMVGPECARYLGDWGAEVVKLESRGRMDPLHSVPPFKEGRPGPNRSIPRHGINAGKLSLSLDLKNPAGHEAALRLARWADVWIESFTPGVTDSLGLSYAALRAVNPGIIYLSTSILGSAGPYGRQTSGTGTTGAALAGATNLIGWPDRLPMGPNGPWTDAVAPRLGVTAILAALHRRRHTGEGCLIDLSQAEAGIQFLMPAYFQAELGGDTPGRTGMARTPYNSPSGVYRCPGEDRWIVIDVPDFAAWRGLAAHLPELARDPALDRLVDRLRRREEIDGWINALAAAHEAESLEALLQASGVPAHIVANARDLAHDADLHADGYYSEVTDPDGDRVTVRAAQASLSRTPSRPVRPAPNIGAETNEVLTRICGYDEAEIGRLEAEGALG